MKIHFEKTERGYEPEEFCMGYIIELGEYLHFTFPYKKFPENKTLYTVIRNEVKSVYFINISEDGICGVLMDENYDSLDGEKILTFTNRRDAELFAAAKNELENICSYIDEEVEICDKMIKELKRKKEEALEEKKEYKRIYIKLSEI